MESTFQQEQQRVDNVSEIITEQIRKLEVDTARQRDEVVRIRKHFWDEVKVNVDTFDDYLETIIGLRQEAQALSVSQSTHRNASKRLATLRRMKDMPYFGRIDFIEDGAKSGEQIYIGIGTLTDHDGEDFLIYDWRAPISSVYYDYQPGEASYKTPGGMIQGSLEKKWQYLIRNGVLQSMFDTSLTIGDEILQMALGKGTDKKMNSIVATIQQEQNRIIRHDGGRLLIVHGAAGSGKTSAALQRIAYLLYKNRESLQANQIILFSPNTLFNSYVSNVLPELGEENMQQVTFQEYLNHRLSKDFTVENPYNQLEYVLTAKDSPSYRARNASIRFKASPPFFSAIESYRTSLEQSGMRFNDLVFRGKAIVTADQMAKRFYTEDTNFRFHNRLEQLKDWLLKKVKGFQMAEWSKPWVLERIELLSDEEYHKAHRQLAKKHGLKGAAMADYEVDQKDLARLIVQQRVRPLVKRIKAFEFIDMKGIYRQLFTDPLQIKQWMSGETPAEWPAICQATQSMLDENRLDYEDATPFLLLNELIKGFQANRTIKHVFVDEAQDYSPFQFEFLRRLFPAARMTVLGDFNQAIFAHAEETVDFHMLAGLYGPEETDVINLAKSYRSTKPIIEFTRSLIPSGSQIIPFERNGARPVLKKLANHAELHDEITSKVEEFQGEGYRSIAIICKSAEESAKAYEALSEVRDITLLKTGSFEYERGVVVVPAYLAKGIEFDAVIIYDASKDVYNTEHVRRLFYTACTRAMHALQLYSVGEPSLLLREVNEENLVYA